MEIKDFNKISENVYEIPESYRDDMLVPARIFVNEALLEYTFGERSVSQLINVTTLPGIYKYACAMPDIHEGYGFPIGGVAATVIDEGGVISPGGIGFDINCGVRLLKTELEFDEVKDIVPEIVSQMQRDVPSGLGRGHKERLSNKELDDLLENGAEWGLKQGYTLEDDLDSIEQNGKLEEADARMVSENAKRRGLDQVGTLGAGNHFLEVQRVEKILDSEVAEVFGLREGQIAILVHTGSRGLGHQVATDYLKKMVQSMSKYNISVPDRELACVPFKEKEGQEYFGAMSCAANFAWMNRQMITFMVRGAVKRVLQDNGFSEDKTKLEILYDVAHNIAKLEEYDGKKMVVHRKGATRAFGPGRVELVEQFRNSGQPVIIPGSMGTASYVMVGTEVAMEQSFGSTAHGAGRRLSRKKATKTITQEELKRDLENKGITVRVGDKRGMVEEAPEAYKDIDEVADITETVGISRKVARLVPLGVVKG